ncbi:DUF1249 domain-containing protein [Beggiatoa alba]|nr:DUF1249 domain-containing protein [Beggiatoa alba]
MGFTKYSRPNPMLWYEMNYHTLLQLVPELEMDLDIEALAVGDQYRAIKPPLSQANSEQSYDFEMSDAHLNIRLLELNRYTQYLQVISQFKAAQQLLPLLCLNVRVYHDASLAEVISCTGVEKLLPRYTYPNEKMLLKDEKRQANRLLFEWLSSARAYYRFKPVEQEIC